MPKKNSGRNFNFRQTRSERSATKSYRNFASSVKNKIKKIAFGK